MKYSEITLKTDYPITDFAAERNKLLDQAKTKWVLFVDGDEEVSEELRMEIEGIKGDGGCEGYKIRRRDFFFRKWLEHGETGNIKLLRLGKKGAGRWKRRVHEVWEMRPASAGASARQGELRGELRHYPHKNVSEFIRKINYYTDLDAKELGPLSLKLWRVKVFGYWELAKPIGKFIQNYFLRLGFLDGMAGFVHAFMMSLQSLVVRVKQYDLSKTL
jgi:hypothetical protein